MLLMDSGSFSQPLALLLALFLLDNGNVYIEKSVMCTEHGV